MRPFLVLAAASVLAAGSTGPARADDAFALDGRIAAGEVWRSRFVLEFSGTSPGDPDAATILRVTFEWTTRVIEAGERLELAATFTRLETSEATPTGTRAVSRDERQLARLLGRDPTRPAGELADVRLTVDRGFRALESSGFEEWFWLLAYAGLEGADEASRDAQPPWLRLVPRSALRRLEGPAHRQFVRLAGPGINEGARDLWTNVLATAAAVLDRLHEGGTFRTGDEIAHAQGTIRYLGGPGAFHVLPARGKNPLQAADGQGWRFTVDGDGRIVEWSTDVDADLVRLGVPLPAFGARGAARFQLVEVAR